jgi:4-alpha-glucanotransferase
MANKIRFCLVLHNHQPVGNFDYVFEDAYRDSYLPFVEVLEGYPELPIGLHISGPLAEWLDARYPDYLDRIGRLVARGQIEVVGGGFYEPILTMIPSRDRVGQIRKYSEWLEQRLGGQVRGAWIAERVWEQSLVRDLVRAGIRYTVIDDFHFKAAGLTDQQLAGYYLTEDDGRVLSVFPGSERLRYLIPFGQPHETIEYLRAIAERQPDAVVVFGDDGEKFGTWPETHKHVYQDGWLRRFLDLLLANREWIEICTPSAVLQNTTPLGTIYLPDASYREMTEWVLPPERLVEYEDARHQFEDDPRWAQVAPFVRGGFWRNFKVRYPEANEMYARMMMVSRRLNELVEAGTSGELVDHARTELYRGQCNCPYWHGAFGGIYLPHLRNTIYNHLIAAENLLDQATGRAAAPWVEATVGDYNFDAHQEVRLAGNRLVALVAPASGGMLYELDVRTICHNLLGTLARRPEAYHRKVAAGASANSDGAASIHERVVFKQEGLDRQLQYDAHLRKSLIDHFFDNDVSLEAVAAGAAMERGDFVHGIYEARIRRKPERIQVQMRRKGNAWGIPLEIIKGVTLEAGSSTLEIAYQIEGLPPDAVLHLAVELNFAGMPAGADDRYFHDCHGNRHGQLGSRLELCDLFELALTDEWLGLDVSLSANRATSFWAFPVQTVSQSEGGFELVHQSVVVMPHWLVQPDEQGRWSVRLQLHTDTTLAESRMEQHAVVAAGIS